MGNYEKYVNDLRLWTELVRPSYRGRMADFSLIFDRKVFSEAEIWVENFHIFAPGAGVMIPGEIPMLMESKPVPSGTGQHAHPDFDELFLFFGSNPHDNLALGGELEFWLGEGEDAQKFISGRPAAEWVPRNVAHNPHYFTKVKDAKWPIIEMAIALTPTYSLGPDGARDLPWPPAFSLDKVGKEQKGKGLYTEYVRDLRLASDRIFPSHRGRVSVPSLVFDDSVYPGAPLRVEIFHIFAAGAGTGVPALEPPIFKKSPPGMPAAGGHAHSFDQLFLFLGTDPHDTLNLGGEVEFWLGEGKEAERFRVTKASSEYVPAGLVHNPHYFRSVERPFIMAVISVTSDYDPEGFRYTSLPPGFSL